MFYTSTIKWIRWPVVFEEELLILFYPSYSSFLLIVMVTSGSQENPNLILLIAQYVPSILDFHY